MSSTERRRLVAAAVQGIAAGYAHMRNRTAETALQQIHAALAPLQDAERKELLDDTAAVYLAGDHYWADDAIALLLAAGAKRDRAERIAGQRPTTRGLGGLGEQA